MLPGIPTGAGSMIGSPATAVGAIGAGYPFKDIFTGNTLYSGFIALRLLF